MDLGLKDQVVIVSGGASGIGAAIVESLKAEGAVPVIFDLADGRGEDFYQIDLCDDDAVAAAIRSVIDQKQRIDAIVNNAGVNDGVSLSSGKAAFEASLSKNLTQCYCLVHHALDPLKQSRGSIVNIGSKVAMTGQGGTSGYAASKGGLLALTREWALELACYGVRSNAVIPAEVWTPMYERWLHSLEDPAARKKEIERRIPLGARMTLPEEIADMVVFLLSKRSLHTTGQIINVDGGYTHLDRAYISEP
ncbi:MAG: SDR family oxidoreductase [Verrucomicrobiota bacterium]